MVWLKRGKRIRVEIISVSNDTGLCLALCSCKELSGYIDTPECTLGRYSQSSLSKTPTLRRSLYIKTRPILIRDSFRAGLK